MQVLILKNLFALKWCNMLWVSQVFGTKNLGCESSLQKAKTPAGTLALRNRWDSIT
jgi:hypothetical protein